MDKRMIMALALSLLMIVVYTRFIAPPPPRAKTHAAPPVQTAEPSPKEAGKAEKARGPMEVVEGPFKGKLSTVSTEAMELIFSKEAACISSAVLRKSDIVKKGPIEIIRPLSPDMQPVALCIGPPCKAAPEISYQEIPGGQPHGEMAYSAVYGGLKITKRYLIAKDRFLIKAKIELSNEGEEDVALADGIEIGAGTIFGLTKTEKEAYVGVDILGGNGRVKRISASKATGGREEELPIEWLAIRNQFFAIVVKPKGGAAGYRASSVKTANGLFGVEAKVKMPGRVLKPGETAEIPLDIYIGPKEYSALASFGAVEVIDFGWFGFLGTWILKALNALYAMCGNYGLAIILLTVIIRIILYPLNQKSFKSMKEMQKIQPEIAALQEKCKNDPKKKQQEMMRIYREKGINPMGGCLPLLVQMPILIAFFRVLQNAIELWGAPFALWIKDLSEPDALMRISTGKMVLPFIGKASNGNGFIFLNILPILMLVVFYIQQKMSTPGAAITPEQAQQQKMMGWMMPVMFGVIFYNMPAGLNLYFAASTLLGILQQKYMIR